MCGNILWEASSSKAFYRADALFILGTWYLSLGVLRRVFGVRYAVSVLVTQLRIFSKVSAFVHVEAF